MKRDQIPDHDTTGRARAQGGQQRTVLSIAGPARRRGRVGNTAQARTAAPYFLHRLVVPGMQPRLAGVRVPPAVFPFGRNRLWRLHASVRARRLVGLMITLTAIAGGRAHWMYWWSERGSVARAPREARPRSK